MKKIFFIFLTLLPFVFAYGGTNESNSSYQCSVCDYVYNPEKGDSKSNIPAGTSFNNLPENWKCPRCKNPKVVFEEIKK